MSYSTSRRRFLAGSLGAGAIAPAVARSQIGAPKQPELSYRTLGKTGLKVTTVGFGCMITSDMSNACPWPTWSASPCTRKGMASTGWAASGS